jgi:hypothetical protein
MPQGVLFGGRPAEYRYYDMDRTIASALALVQKAAERRRQCKSQAPFYDVDIISVLRVYA